jgi:hypothetical protein
MNQISQRVPVIIIKRKWLDEFAAGRKTIEYRRYGRMFTERTFYPGRRVRLTCQYSMRGLILSATVKRFQRALASDRPDLLDVYPDLKPDAEMALIHLDVSATPDRLE